jgi:polyphosphate kinase 2 (PPK2 family)
LWRERYASIRDHERHLARNGTIILKFWLNVSRDEQRKRFLARIDEPDKNWKFSPTDLQERGHWDAYGEAYEEALAETSRAWAPWYAIPADDKAFMRVSVARVIVDSLKSLDLRYPQVTPELQARFAGMRSQLEDE